MNSGKQPSLACSVLIGIEIIVSTVLAFGPAKARPDLLLELSERGKSLYRPEHDLKLYVLSIAITFILLGVIVLWKRTQITCEGKEKGAGGRLQLEACSIFFALFLVCMVFCRQYGASATNELPLGLILLLFLFPILSVSIVLFDWSKAIESFRSRVAGAHLGFLVPVLLMVLVFIPDTKRLAGRFFLSEEFHHWDYYAMGPTLALRHGIALGTEFYTQYNVGWPMVFDFFGHFGQISYGNLICIAVVYSCVYFTGCYILIWQLTGSRIWAISGVLLILNFQLFSGIDLGDIMWRYPSSTILRSPLDVWFFISTLAYLKSNRRRWLFVSSSLAGTAILFGTDTGVYLCVTLFLFMVYHHCLQGSKRDSIGRFLICSLQCVCFVLIALLPGLWIASNGTLFQNAFWTGWLESIFTYGSGLGMLPIASVQDSTLFLFILILMLYLSMIGRAILHLKNRGSTPETVCLGCISTYGLATLLLFVGRSHSFNIYHVLIPFITVAIVCVKSLMASVSSSAVMVGTDNLAAYKFKWTGSLLFIGAFILLITNNNFRVYPNVIRLAFGDDEIKGIALLDSPKDVCGLPPMVQPYVDMFGIIIDKMKRHKESGKTIAVLDDSDTIFYLAANVPPWGRYSPAFPELITHTAVRGLISRVVANGPDVIVIRSGPEHAQALNEGDTWRAVHGAVKDNYDLEATIGVFEFWTRN